MKQFKTIQNNSKQFKTISKLPEVIKSEGKNKIMPFGIPVILGKQKQQKIAEDNGMPDCSTTTKWENTAIVTNYTSDDKPNYDTNLDPAETSD